MAGTARPACATAYRPSVEPSQFFPGAALYQQWNELAHGALTKPRIRALDYRRNMIVRKFCVLLGKTMLYRIDLCPLSLRHARHHRLEPVGVPPDRYGINVTSATPQRCSLQQRRPIRRLMCRQPPAVSRVWLRV